MRQPLQACLQVPRVAIRKYLRCQGLRRGEFGLQIRHPRFESGRGLLPHFRPILAENPRLRGFFRLPVTGVAVVPQSTRVHLRRLKSSLKRQARVGDVGNCRR